MSIVAKHIESLKPYVPGKPVEELERELGISEALKLASNENPLGPSPMAIEAIKEIASKTHIYPDGAGYKLRETIAEMLSVEIDEVILGNGSNELITLAIRTFCQPGDTAVISDYSFIAYRLCLQAAGVGWTSVAMKNGYVHDLEAMAAACDETTKIVFVANPNNPTGTHVGRAELEDFLRAVPERALVVLDEAYVEYALAEDYVTGLELRDLRERLIVTRTFSKCYGLAGLRVGYGVGPAKLMNYVQRVREPFNANLVGQVAALAALDDKDFVKTAVASNEAGREVLLAGLHRLQSEYGVEWINSQTNFVLMESPFDGLKLYEAMLREGVIVRPMAGYGLPKHLRITIGTPEQTERCLEALGTALAEVS